MTGIQWTDKTWNPLRGCSRVSEGCRNCYAEVMASRFSGPGQWAEGLATRGPARWTGKVTLAEHKLDEPLRWRGPQKIFVNSMSDLFHKDVPDEWIDRIFAVMALAPQHTFQVLTKRPERMREYVTTKLLGQREPHCNATDWMTCVMDEIREARGGWSRESAMSVAPPGSVLPDAWRWPLPNVHLGVSVENQATADARIPLLLQTPAAVRFISAEPLLEPVDLEISWIRPQRGCDGRTAGVHYHDEFCGPRLDWVIVGGESGPGARPFDMQWARALVEQCQAASVPVFVKQMGSWPYDGRFEYGLGLTDPDAMAYAARCATGIHNRKGGDPSEWPEDLRVRQFPAARKAGE